MHFTCIIFPRRSVNWNTSGTGGDIYQLIPDIEHCTTVISVVGSLQYILVQCVNSILYDNANASEIFSDELNITLSKGSTTSVSDITEWYRLTKLEICTYWMCVEIQCTALHHVSCISQKNRMLLKCIKNSPAWGVRTCCHKRRLIHNAGEITALDCVVSRFSPASNSCQLNIHRYELPSPNQRWHCVVSVCFGSEFPCINNYWPCKTLTSGAACEYILWSFSFFFSLPVFLVTVSVKLPAVVMCII